MSLKSTIISCLPVLIGLLACFVPAVAYTLNGTRFSTIIAQDYSGYTTLVLLVLYIWYTIFRQFKRKQMPWAPDIFMGIYLVGFTLFRGYHTFSLYAETPENSLAEVLNAGATVREGLILLAIAGFWFLIRGIKARLN